MKAMLQPRAYGVSTIEDLAGDAVARLHDVSGRLVRFAEAEDGGVPAGFHRVVSWIHDLCDALAMCEALGIDRAEIRTLVDPVRHIYARSPFVRRLQEWPRGYPGDFETIEWLCAAQSRAPEGTLAGVLEHYALTATIAQQHRNKVTFQSACMLDALRQRPSSRILSLACGSSPDLRSITAHAAGDAAFVLCDGDEDALSYSRSHLTRLAGQCTFVHGMVPRVLRVLAHHGPFDLVLVGGLFDYLSDRVVARTLSIAWHTLLAPGGALVFTNIATGNPFRPWLEYIADWPLIERSEEDVRVLCDQAGIESAVQPVRDSTGLAVLVQVVRE